MVKPFAHADLLKLTRFSTPTISNALELYESHRGEKSCNRDETRDFTPHLGPMVGYAVTADYCASRKAQRMKDRTVDLLRLIENSPKPCIVVIRDVDAPDGIVGAPWGECFSNICRALGAVGTITDGAIRDYSEMLRAGFHALARRLCVSHGCGRMVAVGKPVKVFGTTIRSGEILHADQHGFIIIPKECVPTLADTAVEFDRLEVEHIISPTRRGGYDVKKFLESRDNFVRAMARQHRRHELGSR